MKRSLVLRNLFRFNFIFWARCTTILSFVVVFVTCINFDNPPPIAQATREAFSVKRLTFGFRGYPGNFALVALDTGYSQTLNNKKTGFPDCLSPLGQLFERATHFIQSLKLSEPAEYTSVILQNQGEVSDLAQWCGLPTELLLQPLKQSPHGVVLWMYTSLDPLASREVCNLHTRRRTCQILPLPAPISHHLNIACATSDTTSDATSDTTSDATSDTTSDATSDTTSDATSDTISDATSETTSDATSIATPKAKCFGREASGDETDALGMSTLSEMLALTLLRALSNTTHLLDQILATRFGRRYGGTVRTAEEVYQLLHPPRATSPLSGLVMAGAVLEGPHSPDTSLIHTHALEEFCQACQGGVGSGAQQFECVLAATHTAAFHLNLLPTSPPPPSMGAGAAPTGTFVFFIQGQEHARLDKRVEHLPLSSWLKNLNFNHVHKVTSTTLKQFLDSQTYSVLVPVPRLDDPPDNCRLDNTSVQDSCPGGLVHLLYRAASHVHVFDMAFGYYSPDEMPYLNAAMGTCLNSSEAILVERERRRRKRQVLHIPREKLSSPTSLSSALEKHLSGSPLLSRAETSLPPAPALDTDAMRTLRSLRTPPSPHPTLTGENEDDNELIISLISDSYHQVMFNANHDTVVLLYDHDELSKKFKKAYSDAISQLFSISNYLFAQMDVSKEKTPLEASQHVGSFPAILVYPIGFKHSPIRYMGHPVTSQIVEFVKDK